MSKITKSQITLGNIDFTDAGAGAGVNFSGTSTTLADVTGVTTTYTSGPVAERLHLWLSFMVTGSTVNTFFTLNVNGTDLDTRFLTTPTSGWLPVSQYFKADIPANTTVTIKARYRVLAGTVSWGRDSNDVGYRSKIQGFAVSQ